MRLSIDEQAARETLLQRVRKDHTYHAPSSPLQVDFFETFRRDAYELAKRVVLEVPPCREQALALTKLEEAVMWANAGVARHPPAEEGSSG